MTFPALSDRSKPLKLFGSRNSRIKPLIELHLDSIKILAQQAQSSEKKCSKGFFCGLREKKIRKKRKHVQKRYIVFRETNT